MPSETSPLNPQSPRSAAAWWQVAGAGAGFLTDAYDLFVIDLVLHILHSKYNLEVWQQSAIVAAASAGAVIGQVAFGLSADYLGRRVNFVTSCVLLLAGALLSACADPKAPLGLAAARFALGLGIGGEYPLAATIAAESGVGSTDALTRVALVFSMQGVGMLLSCAVVLIPLTLGVDLEVVWRLALGLGAVVPAAVLLQRTRMQETEDFERLRAAGGGDTAGATEHLSRLRGAMWDYRWQLVGTGGSWFLLDVCFYALGSFKARVGNLLVPDWVADADGDIREELVGAATFATVVTCAAMVGYLLSIALLSRIGWPLLQTSGFFVLAVLFLLLGVVQSRLALAIIFMLVFVFFNFGPNTTTFVAPVDVYPVHVRATGHGISAALGKVGAAVGTATFVPVESAYGLRTVAFAAAGICCLGMATSQLATPLKQ